MLVPAPLRSDGGTRAEMGEQRVSFAVARADGGR